MSKRTLTLVLSVVCLVVSACAEDSSGPNIDAYFQQGIVPFQGQHFETLMLTDTYTVKVEMTALEIRSPVPSLPPDPVLTFALGTILEGQESICRTSFADQSRVGDRFSFRLDEGTYCFRMSDSGNIPVDGEAEYTLLIEPI